MALESGRSSRRRGSASTTRATGRSGPSGFAGTPRTYRGRSPRPPGARGAAENLDERFGDPGGPDPGEATSSAASASSMRERAAQSLNPEMGRMGAEDPSTAFSAAPLHASFDELPGHADVFERRAQVADRHSKRVDAPHVGVRDESFARTI